MLRGLLRRATGSKICAITRANRPRWGCFEEIRCCGAARRRAPTANTLQRIDTLSFHIDVDIDAAISTVLESVNESMGARSKRIPDPDAYSIGR